MRQAKERDLAQAAEAASHQARRAAEAEASRAKQAAHLQKKAQTQEEWANLAIVKASKKDVEYIAVKNAMLDRFPEKLEECIPPIQAYHKNRFNLYVVVEDKLEVVVYFDSDHRSRMLISKSLRT